jgi:hypothetical protein
MRLALALIMTPTTVVARHRAFEQVGVDHGLADRARGEGGGHAGHSSQASQRGTCAYPFEISEVGSRLHLSGQLNGYALTLKHDEISPRPSGLFSIVLSPCPPSGSDTGLIVLKNFEFTFSSRGTVSIHPLDNLEVRAPRGTAFGVGYGGGGGCWWWLGVARSSRPFAPRRAAPAPRSSRRGP